MSFAAPSHGIMAHGEKRPCNLGLSVRNLYPQCLTNFGEWNTGTYVHFRPHITVIRTYTPQPQIKIEHNQLKKKDSSAKAAYTPFTFQFTALCSGLQNIHYITITHQNTAFNASSLNTHFKHILNVSARNMSIFRQNLPFKTKYILNT
jgi:hypothetical protein